ncbi:MULTISPECIES: permease-like cell division protein FtsX [unclassified Thauera]|uniref:permease-like cell division protein FtsX n=1 Tax=unclassified Thauera TaxID=2609274 RepID=UPI0002D002F5|nr:MULTISPECIES: permease-like cell division protein FtsX [unclassified Thauera]ENO81497.1 cell division protein FtsX [Thauera sp. 27]WBL64972.1 permease-like cell division protein FtsX [Thauera sp. WB-2]HAG76772.1 ABC transporter permease [Thauera sp.]HAY11240.1 ABC transporter permease [Thauera sp.]HNR61073.1 permease-like cell division protein FtsX [Thauera sp.]
MIHWLYLHLRAIAHALRRLAAQPLSTLLSALVVGIALSLPGGGYLLLDNVSSLARGVSGAPEISLFLDMDAGPEDRAAIEQRLKATPDLGSYRFVARDEALRQLEASGLGDVLGGLSANPLPDAFVLSLREEDPELFERMAEQMAAWPKVAHVQLDSAWVKRLHALLGLGRSAVLMLAGLLGFALVIVTFNTIRLQILTQRQEIAVSRLLGATDPFIRRPFYWFGGLQGALGGLVALGTVSLGVRALSAPVTALAETYGAVFVLSGPDWRAALAIVAFAALLGWLGAAISVRRHLAGA